MNEEIRQIIKKEMFKDYKDKINKDETLEEYFNSFIKDKLVKLIEKTSLIEDNSDLLAKGIFLQTRTKKEVLKYMLENYADIYKSYFYVLEESTIRQLEIFIREYPDGYVENLPDNFSIKFICDLVDYNFAKVNYTNQKLNVYIPEKIILLIKKYINNKNVIKTNKENNLIRKNINSLLKVYGILPFDKLYEIYNKVFNKIDENDLQNLIYVFVLDNNNINILKYDNTFLVSDRSFEDEDKAYTFYESIEPSVDYKIYTRKEYIEIENETYHHKFKEYKELVKFLLNTFDMNQDDITFFDEEVILDYIYSMEVDEEEASHNLDIHLKDNFIELTKQDEIIIKNYIKEIFTLYPAFILKGHTIDEM